MSNDRRVDTAAAPDDLARSWAHLGHIADPRWAQPGSVVPLTVLGEPVLLVRDHHQLRLLSNVCTHRGMLLAELPCRTKELQCRYHGRAFSLDGRVLRAPGLESDAFPAPEDHLAELPIGQLGDHLFGSPLGTLDDFRAASGDVPPPSDATAPTLVLHP